MMTGEFSKGQIILYKKNIEVHFEKETVWLTQKHMAQLFDTERSARKLLCEFTPGTKAARSFL